MIFVLIAILVNSAFWLPFEEAFSVRNDKMIMIYFHMDHCSYCEKMERKIWKDKSIQKNISKKFFPIEINISDPHKKYHLGKKEYFGKEIAQMLQVKAYPTVVFLEKNGNVKFYLAQYLPKKDFFEAINIK
jgi:thioredoxin-related protein